MSEFRLPGISAGDPRGDRPGTIPLFRPGQILTGQLLRESGTSLLQIGNQRLNLEWSGSGTRLPDPGSRLLLEVIQARPQLAMRVLEVGGEGPARQAEALSRLTADMGSRALSTQLDSRELLNSLRTLMRLPASGDQRLALLRELLAPVMQASRSPRELQTTEGVARAMADSGLNMERRLLQPPSQTGTPLGGDPLGRDWKAALGRSLLAIRGAQQAGRLPPTHPGKPQAPARGAPPPPPGRGWITQTPVSGGPAGSAATGAGPTPAGLQGMLLRELPEALRIIVRQVEGALGRSELHQLASGGSEAEGSRNQLWFEIPVSRKEGDDIWQFNLQRERGRSDESQDRWSLTLAVELTELGPFYARLKLQGERLGIHLYAREADTVSRIRDSLSAFRERMQNAGLKLDRVQVSIGEPAVPAGQLPVHSFRSQA